MTGAGQGAEPKPRADWSGLREEYARGGLRESDLTHDPFEMFDRWMADAVEAGLPEPNAMVVSTVGADGRPSSRMVLLKGFSVAGWVFFTNQASRKGRDLAANPACSLLFPWHPVERQVRIEGIASSLGSDEVAAYFALRPRGSRIGAWASHQSREVRDRDELTAAYERAEERFADDEEVPVPKEWGGYRVAPHTVEFWQGRPGRMHDRLVYRRTPDDGWSTHRLAP